MNNRFYMLLLLVAFAVPCLSFASTNSGSQTSLQTQVYHFDFRPFHGETYSFETKNSDHDEAYRKAADACFNHFKQGRHISMEEGQDIIDICVNPKKF